MLHGGLVSSNIAPHRPAGSFLRKRFLRIYPAFWGSILVIMATPYLLAGLSALKTGNFILPEPRWLALGPIVKKAAKMTRKKKIQIRRN